MAIDEALTNSNSTFNSNSQTNMFEWKKKPPIPTRMGHLLARKQRIEHWAYDGRSTSIGSDRARTSSVSMRSVSTQKRSESVYSQSTRRLNMNLLQLGEQRQKVIDQRNFDQKLFANKQALKHKENPSVLSTLNYVRKCCKYVDKVENEENSIDPTIFLEENANARRARSRSRSRSPSATPPPVKRSFSNNSSTQTSASLAETFLQHNRKHLESYRKSNNSRASSSLAPSMTRATTSPAIDDETQKRHVQFQIQPESFTRNAISAFGVRPASASQQLRSINSAPLVRPTSSSSETQKSSTPSPQPRRSLSRIRSAKSCLEEFRLHPERFLSATNRYLPLLRRQAIEVKVKEAHSKQPGKMITPSPSRLSDGSDMTYDDAKSFLSEETEFTKMLTNFQVDHERKIAKTSRSRPSSKIDMMDAPIEDDTERQMALARLRDREYAHLNELIHSNSIEDILEPFSPMKTDEHEPLETDEQKRLNYQSHQSTTGEKETSATTKMTKIKPLNDIIDSIDSLRCSDSSDRRARRQVDLEKNRAKLGILIF